MSKAFDRIKAGLEDAIEYASGETKDRRVHQMEAPSANPSVQPSAATE